MSYSETPEVLVYGSFFIFSRQSWNIFRSSSASVWYSLRIHGESYRGATSSDPQNFRDASAETLTFLNFGSPQLRIISDILSLSLGLWTAALMEGRRTRGKMSRKNTHIEPSIIIVCVNDGG